jgi:hypothetical protein
MFGSFLPSLGRQATKFTQVEGADIVMKSYSWLVLQMSGLRANQALRALLVITPDFSSYSLNLSLGVGKVLRIRNMEQWESGTDGVC